MEPSAFRALARHLRATLSSSPLPPLISPLRRRPFKTLLPLALPGCRLSSAASLLRSAAGDRFARLFSSISSDQDLELREGKESPSSRSAEDEYKDPLLQAQQEKQSRFVPVKAYFLCTRCLDSSLVCALTADWGLDLVLLLWNCCFWWWWIELQHWFEEPAGPERNQRHSAFLSCHQLRCTPILWC